MSHLFQRVCLLGLVAVAGSTQEAEIAFQDGDVVLQASRSSRSALIRKASRSPYSHVGVIEVAEDGVFVIEAIAPVSRTPMERWRRRGVGQRMTVLRARTLDGAARHRVVIEAKQLLGKPYDARYRWDDQRIYCSELVAKAFERGAALKVGTQQQVRSLQLTSAELLYARLKGVPGELWLVTPASIAEDKAFDVVSG